MRYAVPLIVLIGVLFAVECGALQQGQHNATWAGSVFFRGFNPSSGRKLTNKELDEFSVRLKRNGIHYAYIFSGPYQKDGKLPAFAFSERARESVTRIKKNYPELKIFPWVGGVQGKTIHLEDGKWVSQAIEQIAKLLKEIPLDGVHLDLEYVLDGRDLRKYARNWVGFHRSLRMALPRAFLSTTMVSTASGVRPWKHQHSLEEAREIASLVDQVSFMFYDTGIHESKAYRDSLREQIGHIQNLKEGFHSKSPQFLIGVGTFESVGKLGSYRDSKVENLPITLDLTKQLASELSPKTPLLDGLAIYCEWCTDPKEWEQIRERWVRAKQF